MKTNGLKKSKYAYLIHTWLDKALQEGLFGSSCKDKNVQFTVILL